ncbi:MAG: AbrB/MazE/SpoVT family DNA-binding domain-containing protein [Thaumarchaeota archaeon]|nr:AbrB/MazE/SpoVT family DNA-binding domain-containing protein [Nitrososphaerota archaeon]
MTSSMRVSARITRIGNSLGIVIPTEEAKRHGLKEGDTVELEVEKRANLLELFGSVRLPKTAQELKNEMREDWGE